jgi:hypothetical protein
VKGGDDDEIYVVEEKRSEKDEKVDQILQQLFSIQHKPVGTLVHLKME